LYCATFCSDVAENMEISKFLYAFLGRTLHEIDKFDQWQVVPCFLGEPGTGKSCIVHLLRSCFYKEDTSIISNRTEKTFGIANHYWRFITIMEEVSKGAQLDNGDFLSMCTGGDMEIRKKHKDAETQKWMSSLVITGNEFAAYVNNMVRGNGNLMRVSNAHTCIYLCRGISRVVSLSSNLLIVHRVDTAILHSCVR